MKKIRILQSTTPLADPHILSDIRDRRSIIDALYDGLVRRDDTGQFQPWLATQWSQPTTTTWRFVLRPNVQFHNGHVLTADDVVSSLYRAISPTLPGELGTEGVLRSYLVNAQFIALNPLLVEIQLESPMADLLDLLVDIPVVPADALAGLPTIVTGTGPYRLTEATATRIEMSAFEHYWGNTPSAEQLVWLCEPDATRRWQRFVDGEADLISDIPHHAQQSANWHIHEHSGYLCIILLMNLFDGPLTDKRVRQAIQHAVDIEALIADQQITAGHANALTGPLTRRHLSAAATQYRTYDPVRARALLAEAGYSQGLTLHLDLPARFPDEAPVLATHLAAQLSAVGINLSTHIHTDRPGYSAFVRSKQPTHLACFDSSPASAWRVFKEKLDARVQGPWWQGYHNPVLHELLDQLAETNDPDSHRTLWESAYALIQEDVPWLFLYTPHHRWATTQALSSWSPSIEGRIRF